jgi:hypothetical protein
MTISPSSIALYADEQENIELKIDSSTKLNSYA